MTLLKCIIVGLPIFFSSLAKGESIFYTDVISSGADVIPSDADVISSDADVIPSDADVIPSCSLLPKDECTDECMYVIDEGCLSAGTDGCFESVEGCNEETGECELIKSRIACTGEGGLRVNFQKTIRIDVKMKHAVESDRQFDNMKNGRTNEKEKPIYYTIRAYYTGGSPTEWNDIECDYSILSGSLGQLDFMSGNPVGVTRFADWYDHSGTNTMLMWFLMEPHNATVEVRYQKYWGNRWQYDIRVPDSSTKLVVSFFALMHYNLENEIARDMQNHKYSAVDLTCKGSDGSVASMELSAKTYLQTPGVFRREFCYTFNNRRTCV